LISHRRVSDFDDLTRNQNAEIESSDEFIKSLKRLGVVLESDVNAAFKEHEKLLEQSDEAYRRGEITRTDFEAIEKAVAQANVETTKSFRDQTDAVDESAGSIGNMTRKLDEYGRSADSTAASVRNLTAAEEERRRAGPTTSEQFGGTLLGGSKLFPNSAIANTSIRNGNVVYVGG